MARNRPPILLERPPTQTARPLLADLSSLRADLDRIDAWIADGVIGGPQPNAADYQIAPSLRLLMSFDDLRPFIEGRPCGEMAMRVAPEFPGRTPQIFPADWLAGLRR
jgi:glutathione S-transferase